MPTLGEGEHHEVAVQVRKTPFVSVNESYVRFSLLGDQSLVSGLSEIDITMLAEKLSVGRKRNVKVEAWTVQCLAHSGEIGDTVSCPSATVSWANRFRVSTTRIRGSAVVLLELRNDLSQDDLL